MSESKKVAVFGIAVGLGLVIMQVVNGFSAITSVFAGILLLVGVSKALAGAGDQRSAEQMRADAEREYRPSHTPFRQPEPMHAASAGKQCPQCQEFEVEKEGIRAGFLQRHDGNSGVTTRTKIATDGWAEICDSCEYFASLRHPCPKCTETRCDTTWTPAKPSKYAEQIDADVGGTGWTWVSECAACDYRNSGSGVAGCRGCSAPTSAVSVRTQLERVDGKPLCRVCRGAPDPLDGR